MDTIYKVSIKRTEGKTKAEIIGEEELIERIKTFLAQGEGLDTLIIEKTTEQCEACATRARRNHEKCEPIMDGACVGTLSGIG